jgi:glycosyltransferase involved in cell wall biosynthesis
MLRADGVGLVHAHSRRDYVIAVLGVALARLRSGYHPRLILHAHMIRPLGSPPRLSGRFFQWGVDGVVAVSRAVADRLRHDHDFSPTFIHPIYNGIPLDEYAASGSPEARVRREGARREWGFAPDALVLGMVGRLDAKGQAALIDALPALAPAHPGLRVFLIGGEGRAGERARLTARAAAAGEADRLIFLGPREDVPALLPAFDALVHLPRDESFGLAPAEAMAAGLPTIATAVGGCREVVRDGETGLLVPPGDAPALAGALLWLLDPAQGAARRAALGRAGRRVVEREFSRERQVTLLQALYGALCPAPAP